MNACSYFLVPTLHVSCRKEISYAHNKQRLHIYLQREFFVNQKQIQPTFLNATEKRVYICLTWT